MGANDCCELSGNLELAIFSFRTPNELDYMNREHFKQLLAGERESTPEDGNVLKQLLEEYPFFQAAHFLYAKQLQNEDHIHFEKALKRAAAHAGDRSLLYRYLYKDQKPEKEPLPTQEEQLNRVEPEAIAQPQETEPADLLKKEVETATEEEQSATDAEEQTAEAETAQEQEPEQVVPQEEVVPSESELPEEAEPEQVEPEPEEPLQEVAAPTEEETPLPPAEETQEVQPEEAEPVAPEAAQAPAEEAEPALPPEQDTQPEEAEPAELPDEQPAKAPEKFPTAETAPIAEPLAKQPEEVPEPQAEEEEPQHLGEAFTIPPTDEETPIEDVASEENAPTAEAPAEDEYQQPEQEEAPEEELATPQQIEVTEPPTPAPVTTEELPEPEQDAQQEEAGSAETASVEDEPAFTAPAPEAAPTEPVEAPQEQSEVAEPQEEVASAPAEKSSFVEWLKRVHQAHPEAETTFHDDEPVTEQPNEELPGTEAASPNAEAAVEEHQEFPVAEEQAHEEPSTQLEATSEQPTEHWSEEASPAEQKEPFAEASMGEAAEEPEDSPEERTNFAFPDHSAYDLEQSLEPQKEPAEKQYSRQPDPLELINRFIKEEPRIRPQRQEFYNPDQMAKRSVEEDEDLISETLARINENQGNYRKAIRMYEKLSLRMPEKSTYFATRIKELKLKLKD